MPGCWEVIPSRSLVRASGKLGMQLRSLFALISLAIAVDGHSMTIHVKPTVLQEGQSIEAECEVTKVVGSSLFIVWFRREPSGKEVEMATNSHVNEGFSRTGRYKARHEFSNKSTALFVLNIHDARTSDSGEIGCKLPNSFEISKVVSVITPVSSVQLMSKDVNNTNADLYASGHNVVFNEEDIFNLTCRVNASYPQPNITISTGPEDITSLFQVSHRLVTVASSKSLPTFYYESLATPKVGELRIRYRMNDRKLTCSALHHGSPLPPVSVSIFVNVVQYLPKFDCPTDVRADLFQEKFTIECSIHSNPGVEHASVWWKKLSVFNETIMTNSTFGNYRLHLSPNLAGVSNLTRHVSVAENVRFQSKLVFLIDRMFPQTFRVYQLEARNLLGSTTHQVVVMETKNALHGDIGSASSPAIPTFSSSVALAVMMMITFDI